MGKIWPYFRLSFWLLRQRVVLMPRLSAGSFINTEIEDEPPPPPDHRPDHFERRFGIIGDRYCVDPSRSKYRWRRTPNTPVYVPPASKSEVMDWLRANPGQHTCGEISEALGKRAADAVLALRLKEERIPTGEFLAVRLGNRRYLYGCNSLVNYPSRLVN